MHRQPPYMAFPASGCGLKVTRDLCERVLALPMHPYLEPAQQQQIADAMRAAI